jgi:hypothetical protein
MPEHPAPHNQPDEEELEKERGESTDLGYRDTEEERAYEEAAEEDQDAE